MTNWEVTLVGIKSDIKKIVVHAETIVEAFDAAMIESPSYYARSAAFHSTYLDNFNYDKTSPV